MDERDKYLYLGIGIGGVGVFMLTLIIGLLDQAKMLDPLLDFLGIR